jgi:pimeloyl-ACP methyl ester carboxylesterase
VNRLETSRAVSIPIGGQRVINGDLSVPLQAGGIVIFAHGSGSSRNSPRNQYVARVLNEGNLATLLIDLLTPDEEDIDLVTSHLRFDIPLLAERLISATDWTASHREVAGLPIGYFGASTGAAAALIASVQSAGNVKTVVSRGGRPDLAKRWLSKVVVPTLLIVGARDDVVIDMNRDAAAQIPGETRIEIVPGATHLFEEKGALEQVAAISRDWFEEKLRISKAA